MELRLLGHGGKGKAKEHPTGRTAQPAYPRLVGLPSPDSARPVCTTETEAIRVAQVRGITEM
jgi:hypothetical protein